MRYATRKSIKWFMARTGKHIVKNNTVDLFQTSILILSKNHAEALHASQDRGHRYK